jgi:hypothetical protein
MLAGAEEAGFTWPLISEDVKEFLTDCGCPLAKKNHRKKMKWGKPEEVLPEDNALRWIFTPLVLRRMFRFSMLWMISFGVQKYGKTLVNLSLSSKRKTCAALCSKKGSQEC